MVECWNHKTAGFPVAYSRGLDNSRLLISCLYHHHVLQFLSDFTFSVLCGVNNNGLVLVEILLAGPSHLSVSLSVNLLSLLDCCIPHLGCTNYDFAHFINLVLVTAWLYKSW